MTKHFIGNASVRALLKNKVTGKVLVTRGPNDKIFEIPGGRLDEGENLEENIYREMQEELNIDVHGTKLEYIFSAYGLHVRDNLMQLSIVFLLEIESDVAESVSFSNEVAETVWVDKENYLNYQYFKDAKDALDKYFKL